MGKIPSLRAMNNKLREDANNLGDAIDELSEEIDLLEPEADRAAEVTGQLQAIANAQQVNVDKLVELVKENEEILAKMRDNLRQRIVQDIITIVIKSDSDNDQIIDKSEAKTLALRIRIQLQEYGVGERTTAPSPFRIIIYIILNCVHYIVIASDSISFFTQPPRI